MHNHYKYHSSYKCFIKSSPAFTIVEILVVIVVIGILATISIVSYAGISKKAIVASIQSDLDSSFKRLKLFQIENSIYPTSITDCPSPANGNICIKSSGSNIITSYVVDNSINPQGFCVNIKNGNNSYKVTSTTTTTPVLGDCVGTSTTQDLTADYQTPGSYTWSVPTGVSNIKIEAWGAQGAKGGDVYWGSHGGVGSGSNGGLGGYSRGSLLVSAGDILNIAVGVKPTDVPERDISYEWQNYIDVGPIKGSDGGESSITRSAILLAKGYGGPGGNGGGYHADSDYSQYDYLYGGSAVANGGAYVNSSYLTLTSLVGTKSGNGRVLLSYQRTTTELSY